MNSSRQRTFTAVLRRDGLTVQELTLTRDIDDAPPATLRFPTGFLGAAAWDVYRLTSAEQWPIRAHYDHEATTPRTAITR